MKLTADRATRRVIGTRASPDAAAAVQRRATVVGDPARDRQSRYDGWVERGRWSGFAQAPDMGGLKDDGSGRRPANRLGSLDATQRAPVRRWRAADSKQRWFVRSSRPPL